MTRNGARSTAAGNTSTGFGTAIMSGCSGEAGFTILEESPVPGEPTAEIVNNVAPQFRKYEPADLFALKGRIIAR